MVHRRINHNLHFTRALAFIGIVIAAYAMIQDFSTLNVSGFCEISNIGSCDFQTMSFKTALFGIPVSVWLLAIYAIILYACHMLIGKQEHSATNLKTLFFSSMLGVIIAFYIVMLQLSVQHLVPTLSIAITFIIITVIHVMAIRNIFYEHLLL